MVPPAPPRLSIMTLWPSRVDSLLGREPRHGVGRPAGGERYDHLDDAAWVGLRIGVAGEGGGRCNGTGEPRATADHGVLSRPVVQTVVLVGRPVPILEHEREMWEL